MSIPSAAGTKSGRGGTLDVLRFAAALFVVLFHYGDESPVPLEQLNPVFQRGYLATDFFLMLSGYVLGRAYGRAVDEGRIGPLEFITRRIARIWPAHLVVLTLMIAVVGLSHAAGFNPHHGGRFNWSDLWPQAMLVQAWGDVGGWGWNIPTWSLSALVVCYAVFPALWTVLWRLKLPAAILAALTAVGVSDGAAHLVLGRGLFDLPFYLGVARALPLFLTGMVMARWAERAPLDRGLAVGLGVGAGALLLTLQLIGRFDAAGVGLIALIILCAGSVPVNRPMPWAEAAGKLSFSLFITHILVSSVWFGVLHATGEAGLPLWLRWSVWAAALPAAFVTALVFDRLVDGPLQARIAPWLKRAFRPRPGRYPAPAPSA
jgi:peptidoglycan/LPS O-acetylase OafA/YrhL